MSSAVNPPGRHSVTQWSGRPRRPSTTAGGGRCGLRFRDCGRAVRARCWWRRRQWDQARICSVVAVARARSVVNRRRASASVTAKVPDPAAPWWRALLDGTPPSRPTSTGSWPWPPTGTASTVTLHRPSAGNPTRPSSPPCTCTTTPTNPSPPRPPNPSPPCSPSPPTRPPSPAATSSRPPPAHAPPHPRRKRTNPTDLRVVRV